MSIGIVNLWDTAKAVATTAAITSEPISQVRSKGYCSLLLILAGAGPSVDVTITVAKSDTDTFYTPYDTSDTDLGAIVSTVTATKWYQFSPVVAPYFKIVITGDGSNGADTTVQAYLMFDEEV